ncbi:MAG TPA: TIGR01777 family oxidoreductase [Alcaligenes sp.]|nr:TIGR01777 family oxidoreductase [Alcaligenes sp.]HRL27501.1 TIGR01777 family oxidoreductase [Alcaligenes sp.]
MRILLTGGTGLIGRALCKQWKAQGHDVWVWSRRPHEVAGLCSGAQGLGALEQWDSAQTLDAVVNLAGAPIADRPWTAGRRQVLWRSRVDLTRTLVDWLARLEHRPSVLVSGSAVGWYGDGGDLLLDEERTLPGQDFGSRLCAAWEQEAIRAESLGIRVVRVRTAPVLADGQGILKRLAPVFGLGLGGRLGSGRQWMPWIHLDDEVGLIDFLLQHQTCSGPFNACAPGAVRNADFTRALASVLGRPAFLPVPEWLLKATLGELSVLLLGGQRLQPRRCLEAGYVFRYPDLQPALKAVLGT